MKYIYENKAYTVPDAEIDKLVEQLDISIAEACELYLTDHDLITNETVEELNAKATKNRITATIHQAKGEKKPRKAREKKVNPLKQELIKAIYENLAHLYEGMAEVKITNDEKYIDFNFEDREFTINLVEHRKKKNWKTAAVLNKQGQPFVPGPRVPKKI